MTKTTPSVASSSPSSSFASCAMRSGNAAHRLKLRGTRIDRPLATTATTRYHTLLSTVIAASHLHHHHVQHLEIKLGENINFIHGENGSKMPTPPHPPLGSPSTCHAPAYHFETFRREECHSRCAADVPGSYWGDTWVPWGGGGGKWGAAAWRACCRSRLMGVRNIPPRGLERRIRTGAVAPFFLSILMRADSFPPCHQSP